MDTSLPCALEIYANSNTSKPLNKIGSSAIKSMVKFSILKRIRVT